MPSGARSTLICANATKFAGFLQSHALEAALYYIGHKISSLVPNQHKESKQGKGNTLGRDQEVTAANSYRAWAKYRNGPAKQTLCLTGGQVKS